MNTEFNEILTVIADLPEHLIVDVCEPVRKIVALFDRDASPEFIIDRAVEACASRASAHRDIAKFSGQLLKDLRDWNEEADCRRHRHGRGTLFNDEINTAVTIEQATLVMFDRFTQYQLYTSGYMPYRFENVNSDGSLLLKKCGTPEEFFDRIAYNGL